MAGKKKTGASVRDVEPGAILDVSIERAPSATCSAFQPETMMRFRRANAAHLGTLLATVLAGCAHAPRNERTAFETQPPPAQTVQPAPNPLATQPAPSPPAAAGREDPPGFLSRIPFRLPPVAAPMFGRRQRPRRLSSRSRPSSIWSCRFDSPKVGELRSARGKRLRRGGWRRETLTQQGSRAHQAAAGGDHHEGVVRLQMHGRGRHAHRGHDVREPSACKRPCYHSQHKDRLMMIRVRLTRVLRHAVQWWARGRIGRCFSSC